MVTKRTKSWQLVCVTALMAACSSGDQGSAVVTDPDAGLSDAAASPDRPFDTPDGAAFDGVAPDGVTAADLGPNRDAGASDLGAAPDAASRDASAGDAATPDGGAGCGPRELCGDGLDNNCNGAVEEGCVCIPGQTQRCFEGLPAQAGRGVCTLGTSRCEGSGEFGVWGPCVGSGRPRTSQCQGQDDRCSGVIDEGCGCPVGLRQPCYSGPPGTAEVGACRRGLQQCERLSSGGSAWGVCEGEVVPQPNRCDGVDLACTGDPLSGCACTEGAQRSCYSGPTGTQGVGRCTAGTQRCLRGDAGLTDWGPCTGEVVPEASRCDGVDRACTGDAMRGCACLEGQTRSCYNGPSGTENVGVCRLGSQACVRGADDATAWGGCTGATLPGVERCNDGLDNNCDGRVDEDCRPCIAASASPWQINRTQGPICYGRSFSQHGEAGQYAFANIPAEGASGWNAVTSPTVDFSEVSALCGRECTCLNGGEFTYFQTFFTVPESYRVTSLRVQVESVDDGVRITVFNSRYPNGVVDPGSYAYLGGGTTTDLAQYIAPGRNRVVLTHLDDCCSARSVTGVRVVVNGENLSSCQ